MENDKNNELKKDRKRNSNLCSFCNRDLSESKTHQIKVFLGLKRGTYICHFCIQIAFKKIQHEDQQKLSPSEQIDLTDPLDFKQQINKIYDVLNEKVVGQEETKQRVLVNILYHKWRLNHPNKDDIAKQHTLIMGDTGNGKTMIVKIIAQELKIPCVIIDASTITKTGYVGDDLTLIPQMLLDVSANNNPEAEKGIVIIDEIDKLCGKSYNKDASFAPTNVQGEFLKAMEEKIFTVNNNQNSNIILESLPKKFFNTKDLMFIGLGAFTSVRESVNQLSRTEKTLTFGLLSVKDNDLEVNKKIPELEKIQKGLIEGGMIAELVGRFQTIINMPSLTKEEYIKLLFNKKTSPFNSYRFLFEEFNTQLYLDQSAAEFIAEKAIEMKLGVRGIYNILNVTIQPKLFDLTRELSNNEFSQIWHLIYENQDLVIKPCL